MSAIIASKTTATVVSVRLNVFGPGYTLERTMHLIGAPGETPRIDTVSIEVEDDDGGRFTVHFEHDGAVAEFALRLLAVVKPFLTEQA